MIRTIRFGFHDKDHLAQAFSIRTKVFVEEQGVDPGLEYDEHEQQATHFLLFLDETAVATARWRTTPEGIKLERFAVLKEHRGQGIGTAILRCVMDDVRNSRSPKYIHAQEGAVHFYEKNGFRIKGKAFVEAGIVHYKMRHCL